MVSVVPWVIGPWVRGPRFYGREAEIAALLPPETPRAGDASGRRVWVAGLRRVGKTSLLRQLELLALEGRRPLLPLVWDLEGIDGPGDLAPTFADALLDAGDALDRLGVGRGEVEPGDDLFVALERLLGALDRRGAELLLLCDEADRLAGIARDRPELVRRLWRAAAGAGGRVVLASSVRLADLAAADAPAADAGAAELVEGFGEPLLLGAMTAAESRELLRQGRLPAAARPAFDDATVETIRERCGDHPMLLQLTGRRCQECGDVGRALAQVAADRTVGHLFEVDLELLTDDERRRLRSIARDSDRGSGAGAKPSADDPALHRLLALGLLRRIGEADSGAGIVVHNRLLADWLLR